MLYLVSSPSNAEKNFELMAQGARVTEAAVQKQRELDSHQFGRQISLRLVFAAASLAVTVLLGRTGKTVIAALPAVSTCYWLFNLNTVLQDRASYQRELDKEIGSVEEIYRKIIEFIDGKRKNKEEFVAQAIHSASFGMTYSRDNFPGYFNSVANNYDSAWARDFSKNTQALMEVKIDTSHPGVRPHVWQQLSKACSEYTTCNTLYNKLLHTFKIYSN